MNRKPVYLAIDIGTGSVRTALFTASGDKISYACQEITTRNPQPDCYEQSTQDIWRSTTYCIRTLTESLNPQKHQIVSIGVDATCSLAICNDDLELSPLPITPPATDKDDIFNVILWLDRRAVEDARYINTESITNLSVKSVISHFGGSISPENEPPKLRWLYRNRPHIFSDNKKPLFFDLSDWLVAALTSNNIPRSACTVACKWGWHDGSWNPSFWSSIGLKSLCDNDFHSIGSNIVSPGTRISTSLSNIAVSDCGFENDSIIVAAPLIDAYAGSVWSFAVMETMKNITNVISFVCGTSTCMLQVRYDEVFVHGVWGPFKHALVKDKYVTEGGQSITGKLLQHIIQTHQCYDQLFKRFENDGAIYDYLSTIGEKIMRENNGLDPAMHVHCLDYHAGNRSPLADATLRGVWTGLSLDTDIQDLATKFRAAVQALCYGARRVVEAMCDKNENESENEKDIVVTACGGLCQSQLFLKELADCLGVRVVMPGEKEADTVLLGSAVLARMAHEGCTEMEKVATKMCKVGDVVHPDEGRKEYHDRKYKVYCRMYEDFMDYRRIMNGD